VILLYTIWVYAELQSTNGVRNGNIKVILQTQLFFFSASLNLFNQQYIYSLYMSSAEDQARKAKLAAAKKRVIILFNI
jgi:hypothetical protein